MRTLLVNAGGGGPAVVARGPWRLPNAGILPWRFDRKIPSGGMTRTNRRSILLPRLVPLVPRGQAAQGRTRGTKTEGDRRPALHKKWHGAALGRVPPACGRGRAAFT